MEKQQNNKLWFMAGGILLLLSALLQIAARQLDGFGQWYAVHIYPWLVGSMGRIAAIFPFSLVEYTIYFLLIGCLIYGIFHIRHRGMLLSRTFVVAAALFFLYTINCGINYYRNPFSDYLGVEIKASSSDELSELCEYLTGKVNQTIEEAETSGYRQEWNEEGVNAMTKLGKVYPQLDGYYPTPKAVTWSYLLSVQQLCGVYSPFTIEANYNKTMTAYNIPLTICHELSHLKGFMREDEANFIGYLACIESDDPAFRHSGYLLGWIYATNALARVDRESYEEIYRQLDPRIHRQLQENALFWDQYEGKVAEVSNKLNDTYLKMNSQSDGVQSYGRVVDLMLAYYRAVK